MVCQCILNNIEIYYVQEKGFRYEYRKADNGNSNDECIAAYGHVGSAWTCLC